MLNIVSYQNCIKSNQSKTIKRYHRIPTRMAILKKIDYNKFWEDVEKSEPSHTAVKNIK